MPAEDPQLPQVIVLYSLISLAVCLPVLAHVQLHLADVQVHLADV